MNFSFRFLLLVINIQKIIHNSDLKSYNYDTFAAKQITLSLFALAKRGKSGHHSTV